MEIREYEGDRRELIDLFLLADEQEEMVLKYLDRGRVFVIEEGGEIIAECLVTDEGEGVLEIKNLAVKLQFQGKSYGKAMIDFLMRKFSKDFSILQVGTGDSPMTVPFYEKCGFKRHHVVKDFFFENYDHPIIESGVQLRDMVYLRRELKQETT